MKLDDFTFDLPDALIAQFPTKERSNSRLMHVAAQSDHIDHFLFKHIVSLLKPNDLLVRNNVKVIKARLFGRKSTGGKLEFMIERVLDDRQMLTQIKASKAPKAGDQVLIVGQDSNNSDIEEVVIRFDVMSKDEGFYLLKLRTDDSENCPLILEDIIESFGHLPLPPYIQRQDESFDEERYQTVFAKEPGAVAAPTAGLHFDALLFDAVKALGVDIAETTLFVGSGTFQPVRVDDIKTHTMHSERYVITQELVEKIAHCHSQGGRVIALGTTSLRALESASQSGELIAKSDETDIFIYPGYQFQCVDALITNFHLPKSTLLMLVAAFSGKERIEQAYAEAIKEQYRFFSYGDAMFLHCANKADKK